MGEAMGARFHLGDCVRLPDRRVGRVRGYVGGTSREAGTAPERCSRSVCSGIWILSQANRNRSPRQASAYLMATATRWCRSWDTATQLEERATTYTIASPSP